MDRKNLAAVTVAAGAALIATGAGCAEKEKLDLQKDCPNQENNKKRCTCKNITCLRWGVCCECVSFHRDKGDKPFCLR
ncbi:MAG: hypothetical protein WC637_19385 [Victivallales bacterium]|jgi:hypothetical protein